ncbi:MAG: ribosome small subunit-dependent GTPase A [Gammaproteobacteria bacterium]|nr:ribosome small subunit-dependent GTPase A [Gammaproteobacteria bacterium]
MTLRDALVTGAFSQRMHLRLDDMTQVVARIKGKKLRPVCGDRVTASAIPNEPDWLITSISKRDNELTRPDRRGRTDVLAANIGTLVVVAAVEPKPDWYVVDRYLASAENMGASAIVVFNKIDLTTSPADEISALSDYERCDYPVLQCSAESGANLDQLAALLIDQTAIIVGQSGVGKSSIINKLISGAAQKTATISASTGEGKHTTVNSVMLDLPNGGAVIDSPGVRDYAPAIETADEVIRGFREISNAGHDCRFANCNHLREPDCAVKRAVDAGDISPRRYESFKRLMNLSKGLADKRSS